jgi:hypothetical protein
MTALTAFFNPVNGQGMRFRTPADFRKTGIIPLFLEAV